VLKPGGKVCRALSYVEAPQELDLRYS
jgi:hypothetical protein